MPVASVPSSRRSLPRAPRRAGGDDDMMPAHLAEPAPLWTRSDWFIALFIFAVALAARLIFLFNSPDRDWPHSMYYEGDAIMWVEWANALDTAKAFEFNLPIHPPAVAYAISWLYPGVHTIGFVGMKIAWCVMSAAACAFTLLACAPLLGRRVGVIAALLLTFSFNQYLLATSLNSEAPYLMLLTAMVMITLRVMFVPSHWLVAALGVLHGAALLLRPEHPLLLMMWVAWLLFSRPTPDPSLAPGMDRAAVSRLPFRTRCACAAGMTLIALLLCLPWTVHAVLAVRGFNRVELDPVNFALSPVEWTADGQAALNALPGFARSDNYRAICDWAQRQSLERVSAADVDRFFHDNFGWTPRPLSPVLLVSNQGAMSFALANHPQSDGGFSRSAFAHPMLGKDPSFAFAFPAHNQVFNDGWRMGWGYIRSDPKAWMSLVGRKFERFADGITCGFGAANLPLGRDGIRQPVDMLTAHSNTARGWQVTMLGVMLAGLISAFARRLRIGLWLVILLYKIIVTILFYGYARQAASIAPVFFILIAVAADTLLSPLDSEEWEQRHWLWSACAVIACVAMLITDACTSRSNEKIAIVGDAVPRNDLGPGVLQSFGKIEIRHTP